MLLRVAGECKMIICSLIQDQTNAKVASWYWLNKKNISLKKIEDCSVEEDATLSKN